MKEIFNKLDLGMKFFIIAIFGIAVIYCILSSIFGLFKSDKEEEKFDVDNVNKYVSIYSEETGESQIDESKLVKDYSTYYTLQTAVQNYIDALIDKDYSKTYSLLTSEMKEKYSKSEYEENIEKLVTTYFVSNESTYDTDYCLIRAYTMGDYMYLCECKTLDNEKSINIGIKLDAYNYTYTVCYIDFN